jgi:hypothetical protein
MGGKSGNMSINNEWFRDFVSTVIADVCRAGSLRALLAFISWNLVDQCILDYLVEIKT